MNKNNIIYEHQYSFRQKHSTQQAITILVDRITHSLDKGDIVISVFIDLKKAFERKEKEKAAIFIIIVRWHDI